MIGRAGAALALLALAAPLNSVPPPVATTAPRNPVQLVEEWSVTCDNLLYCTALSVAGAALPAGTALPPVLRIERGSGWLEQPVITLTQIDRTVAATGLRLGGWPPMGFEGRRRRAFFDLQPAGSGRYYIALDEVEAFLFAAREATFVTVLGPDDSELGSISLAGMVAAIDRMDLVQTRNGTITGIYSRGDIQVPLAAITLPPPATVIAPIGGRAGAAPEPHSGDLQTAICGVAVARWAGDVVVGQMDDGTTIFGVDCGLDGINPGRIWLVQMGGSQPMLARLRLPFRGEGNDWPGFLENSIFDAATGTIHTTVYQRAEGDCGRYRLWQWTGQEAFALVEERLTTHCIGLPPGEWPRTWRAEVGRAAIAQ